MNNKVSILIKLEEKRGYQKWSWLMANTSFYCYNITRRLMLTFNVVFQCINYKILQLTLLQSMAKLNSMKLTLKQNMSKCDRTHQKHSQTSIDLNISIH